jgi:agmatine deiminase
MMQTVYFSSLLKDLKIYKSFYKRLVKLLNRFNIKYQFIDGTNDIWMRDYMPIPIYNKSFIKFDYHPSYLKTPKDKETITDGYEVSKTLGITPIISKIKLEGGNVVQQNGTAFITTRIFKENPKYNKNQLIQDIKMVLKLQKIVLIPDQNDFCGHSDGIVRFVTDTKVIINSYSKKEQIYKNALITVLNKANMKWQEIPCVCNSNYNAIGLYINYLQYKNIIILPVYDIAEDKTALKVFQKIFKNHTIVPLQSNEIAKKGGVLNCISWVD